MAPSTSSTSLMSVVAVLLLLFPVVPALTPSEQAIMAACKTVGGGSTEVGVLFCEEALGSVASGSVGLDYQVFGGVVVHLLADNATSTEGKIGRLLRGGGGDVKLKAEDVAVVARCLQKCKSLYAGIVKGEPACSAAAKAGKFDEATAILEKAASAAKECEGGFGKNNVTSPLTAEDANAYELAKLAVALLYNAREAKK